jgi:hypothetical protein
MTSGIVCATIFYFIELRKKKRFVTLKKVLFLGSIFMLIIVNPLSQLSFILFFRETNVYIFNESFDLWVLAYCYMVAHPAIVIITDYFSSKRNNPNSFLHHERWSHVLSLKREPGYKNPVIDFDVEVESLEGLRYLHGYVEVKPEFMPAPKPVKPKNIELDHSVMSLYFISNLKLDAECPYVVNKKLTNKRSDSTTLQEELNARYLSYVIMIQVF